VYLLVHQGQLGSALLHRRARAVVMRLQWRMNVLALHGFFLSILACTAVPSLLAAAHTALVRFFWHVSFCIQDHELLEPLQSPFHGAHAVAMTRTDT
jgi:hypothetical protein